MKTKIKLSNKTKNTNIYIQYTYIILMITGNFN